VSVSAIPAELRALPQWVRYKLVSDEPKPRKIPVRPSDPDCASSTDPATWGTFEDALSQVGQHGTCGVGFVFSEDYFGMDLDGCLTEEGIPDAKAAALVEGFATYTEISPSGTGLHLIGRGSLNGHRGMNRGGVELYDRGRYFTMTGNALPGAPPTIAECQMALDALVAKLDPPKPPPPPVSPRPRRSDDQGRIVERARAYVSKMPAAISGQGGHEATFRVAIALAKGFSLDAGTALDLLRDFNARCDPPWSEKELIHKIEDAGQADVPDGYILERYEPKSEKSTQKSDSPVPGAGASTTTGSNVSKIWTPTYDVAGILGKSGAGGPRFKTGIETLDERLTLRTAPTNIGTPGGRIIGFIGSSGSGKSVAIDQCALNLARQKLRVAMLVVDEPREDPAERIGQGLGFRHAELNAEYPKTIERVREKQATLDLSILPDEDAPKMPSIEDAAAFLLSVPNDLGHVLAVDGLHTCRSATERDDDAPRIRIETRMNVFRALRLKGILVLFTAEASRGAYASRDVSKRTSAMAAGAESRSIEFGSDALLFLACEGDRITVELPKNRIGRKKQPFSLRLDAGSASLLPMSDEALASEAEGKRTEYLLQFEDKIVKLLAKAPKGLSANAIEGERLGRRDDIRDALRGACDKGKVEKESGARGGGFLYLLPAGKACL